MDAIVLFSHGSVLCGAERNLVEMAARLRERGAASIVEVGFLNYTEPTFLEAVDRCVTRGATRILVAPYFLISGKFVKQDLPGQIDQARARHPEIAFLVAGVIGDHPAMAEAVLAAAAHARPPHEWRAAAQEATRWCRQNPKCPLHQTEGCRA